MKPGAQRVRWILAIAAIAFACAAGAADPNKILQPRRINAGLFNLPEYDRAAEQFLRSGTASEQIAAARKMSELARTYVPLLPVIFRLENDFVQPWLRGFSSPVFSTYWKYLDIDLDGRK